MQNREADFLTRLWELQAEAGLSDADLARVLGIAQSNVSRAKRNESRTVSVKFMLAACDRFPELVFFLFPELEIRTSTMNICTKEGAA